MNRSKLTFINVDSNQLVKYALYIHGISYIYILTLYISIKLKILTQEYTRIIYNLTEYNLFFKNRYTLLCVSALYIIQMDTIQVYSIKLVPFQPLDVSLPYNPDCCPSNIPSDHYLMPLVNLECLDTCKQMSNK